MREEELGIEEDHATRSRVLEAGSLYISTFWTTLLLILLQEFLLLLVSRTITCPEQRHHGMSIFGQNPQDLSKP